MSEDYLREGELDLVEDRDLSCFAWYDFTRMEFLISSIGLGLSLVAVWLSFSAAGVVRGVSSDLEGVSLIQVGAARRKIWLSIGAATVAGAGQAWSGDVFIMSVWVLFIGVQCVNLNALRLNAVKRREENLR